MVEEEESLEVVDVVEAGKVEKRREEKRRGANRK